MGTETEGLISRLAESPEAGPAWLQGLRRAARERLEADGFPGKKHERWRFTSVRDVVQTPFAKQADGDARAWVDERLGEDGTWRLVETDGVPEVEGEPPAGVRVRSLKAVLADEPAALEGVLGELARREHFAALNAALFDDGWVLEIDKDALVDRPLHLVHVATPGDRPRAAYPRLLVLAGEGSKATLVESFLTRDGAERHLTNAVAEVSIGRNAQLEHVRITTGTERALQLAYLSARLDRDARYASRVVTLGGALSRLELDVRFEGPGAEVSLDGAYHVDGADHVDHQITVDHVAGRCTSHVRYRGLLDGKGRAVFNAIGIVRPDAAGSAAHQENRNLLLSDDATVDTKPHLEIECDDVTASHGSTIGAIDEAQLFYLRSRGMPEEQARDVLTYAFVSAVLDEIGHAPVADRAREAILDRLPHGAAIREVLG